MKNIFYFFALTFLQFTSIIYSQWNEQALPGEIAVTLGIDFNNQNHGITGGWYGDLSQQIYGRIFYTNNAGSNWVEASVPDSMRVMVEVQFIDDLVAYGAGAYNRSDIQTTNHPTSHQNLSPALRSYFEQIGIDFAGPENYRGYFVETTDGGLTWHPKGSFEDSVYYLVGISFIDQQNGFVIASSPGASSNTALMTSDGGNTWSFVFPFQEGFFVRSIELFEQIGYVIYENSITSSVFIISTTDGGLTWSPPLQVGLMYVRNVSYVNSSTILINGLKNQVENSVIKSTNAGGDWEEILTFDVQYYLSGVDAAWDTDIILAYGTYYTTLQDPFVDVSLDGGINWTYSQLSQFQDYIPLHSKMIDESRWYITGTQIALNGFVLFTDNAGGVPVELVSFTADVFDRKINLNWTTASELNNLGFEVERKTENEEWRIITFVEGRGTTNETQNYFFTDDLFGLDSQKLFYRLKQIDYDGTFEYSEVVEVEVNVVNDYLLLQNFPNPFNPTTKIKFTIPTSPLNPSPYQGEGQRERLITLKIYDVLGNEIATLVNEEKPVRSYEVEFNGKGLPSGVYFYQLKAGSFVQTKKMVLLK